MKPPAQAPVSGARRGARRGRLPKDLPVSAIRPLEVMISSQVNAPAGDRTLGEVRREIAHQLRADVLPGASIFAPWLSEEQGALTQSDTAWDTCMAAARACDILLVLYTGRAGWVRKELGLGICHSEYDTGVASNPTKVRVVRLDGPDLDAVKESAAAGTQDEDTAFYSAMDAGEGWRSSASTADELVGRALEAVWWALVDLARAGARAGWRSRNLLGESLDWASLGFAERERKMQAALAVALVGQDRSGRDLSPPEGRTVVRPFGGSAVVFRTHAVPGPFALPEARASLGQPFRDEVALLSLIEGAKAGGPIHVIAVHQGVTETQVRKFIGRPDALVAGLPGGAGFFASDDATFTQALFLANCRDGSRVLNVVGEAFDWLSRSKLDETVATRAAARTAILGALRRLAPPIAPMR